MNKLHRLGHAFQTTGRSLQAGGIGGYMFTDSVSPKVTGYLFVGGYCAVLLGEFLLNLSGEETAASVPITVKPITEQPTKIT